MKQINSTSKTKKSSQSYTFKEEIANSLSHGIGVLFGLSATVMLLNKATLYNADDQTKWSFIIYGLSIILLYLASTLYHAIPFEKAKRTLKTLDHSAIFLLIAGTYTPFLMVSLRTELSMILMSVIWLMALCGIALKIFFVYRFKKLSVAVYLVMGWLSLIAIYQLSQSIAMAGVWLLVAGGVVYSAGVFFYVKRDIPYNHAIWHLFVLAGTVLHFLSIYLYVEPVALLTLG